MSNTIDGQEGGGLYNSGDATFTNSILAANSPANCHSVGPSFASIGYNLSSDDSCGQPAPTDLFETEPQLGPLQDNGGPTFTHALAASSPAIDKGNCLAGVTADQRGFPRPYGSQCDIGAFERFQTRLYLPLVIK